MAGTITLEMTGAGIRPMRMMGDRDLAIVIGRFTFDSSYATGGESLAASDVNMQELLMVIPTVVFSAGSAAAGAGFFVTWNPSTSKMVALAASAVDAVNVLTKEMVNGTNLSAYTTRFLAIGYM